MAARQRCVAPPTKSNAIQRNILAEPSIGIPEERPRLAKPSTAPDDRFTMAAIDMAARATRFERVCAWPASQRTPEMLATGDSRVWMFSDQ
jgi:hypothetical protein